MSHLLKSALFISIVLQASCGNMSTHDIEAISHPGYCKNNYGQDLTTWQCNEKLTKDMHQGNQISESDRMIRNINNDLKKENTK